MRREQRKAFRKLYQMLEFIVFFLFIGTFLN